jgi:PhnB protein
VPDGGELIVAEARPGRRTPMADRSHQIMLKVDAAAAIAKRAVELGATLDDEVRDYPYGERQATLTDPFGHQWTLTQTLVDTAPESWGGELITGRRP